MTYPVTYLVGTHRRYRGYLTEYGLPESRHVASIEQVRQTESVTLRDEVIFLTGWQELPEWRELYNWAIVRQNLIRLIEEAREEEGP